jgi:hypothetical protein
LGYRARVLPWSAGLAAGRSIIKAERKRAPARLT